MTAGFLTAWRIWDRFYSRAARLQHVNPEHGNLFRVVVKRYRGERLSAGDGTVLEPGQWYAKLHLHNLRIAQLLVETSGGTGAGEVAMARMLLRETQNSMPALERYLSHHPRAASIRIVMGTTLLYRGAERLGFVIKTVENPFVRRFKAFYFRWIIRFCRPGGWRGDWKRKPCPEPKRVILSRNQLVQLCDAGSS